MKNWETTEKSAGKRNFVDKGYDAVTRSESSKKSYLDVSSSMHLILGHYTFRDLASENLGTGEESLAVVSGMTRKIIFSSKDLASPIILSDGDDTIAALYGDMELDVYIRDFDSKINSATGDLTAGSFFIQFLREDR